MIITFDIETVPTSIDPDWLAAQEAKIREEYVKEDTIQKYLLKAKKNWRWELGGCQPVAIACCGDDGWSWSKSSANTEELIETFFYLLKGLEEDEETRLCGFNILGFDIPVLHCWASRLDIDFPLKLSDRSLIDLIHYPYGRAQTFGRRSLDSYLKGFGLDTKTAHGSEVEEMWASDILNGTETVRQYCVEDVEREFQLLQEIRRILGRLIYKRKYGHGQNNQG